MDESIIILLNLSRRGESRAGGRGQSSRLAILLIIIIAILLIVVIAILLIVIIAILLIVIIAILCGGARAEPGTGFCGPQLLLFAPSLTNNYIHQQISLSLYIYIYIYIYIYYNMV